MPHGFMPRAFPDRLAARNASQVVHKREEFALPMQFYLCRRFGPMQSFSIVHRTSQDNTALRSEDHGSSRPSHALGTAERHMIPACTASPHPCIARVTLITMACRRLPDPLASRDLLSTPLQLLSQQFAKVMDLWRLQCLPDAIEGVRRAHGALRARIAAGVAAVDVTRVPGEQMHAFVLRTHAA